MSLLLGRCSWLRASLTELMGDTGRDVTVRVVDGPPRDLTSNWRTWESWVADMPTAFVASIVTNCPQVHAVVNTIRSFHKDLDSGHGSEGLRVNFRVFLSAWLREPWLANLKAGAVTYGTAPVGGAPPVEQEWVLTTTTAPLAKASELFAMAKEIVLDYDRERESAATAFAWLDAHEELPDLSPPRLIGRPPLAADPQWKLAIALIMSMKAAGRRWPAIVAAVDHEHKELGPFNAEQVRGIFTRERARLEEKKAD